MLKIVKADSVADYLDKYYKRDRYTGRGSAYAKSLLESYQKQFDEQGYVCTSHHDNVTGDFIAWPWYPSHELALLYRRNNIRMTEEDVKLVMNTADYETYRSKGGLLPSGIGYAIIKLELEGRE